MTQTKRTNLENFTNTRLSVQIALTGLSFLVTNGARTEVLHFKEKKFKTARTPEELLVELDEYFSTEISHYKAFEGISIIYSNTEFTVVPAPLFDETRASDYLKFNAKILVNDFIAWDEVKGRDLHVVYVPYVNINNYLLDRFGSFQYYHGTTVLLETLQAAHKYSETPAAFINVAEHKFDLIIQKKGNLLLCNSYHYITPEDFIYYILFCFEQLQINPEDVITVLAGSISKDDALYEIAYTYIREISFYEASANILAIPGVRDHEQILLKSLV